MTTASPSAQHADPACQDLAARVIEAAKAGAVGGFVGGAVAVLFGAPLATPIAAAVGGAAGAAAVELARARGRL